MTLPRARDYRGPRTPVIDVSHWQGEIDWQKVAHDNMGIAAVIVRLGDGKDIDREARRNLRGAKKAGLLVGGYRYLRADHPVSVQIDADRRVLDEAGVTLDLPLCADLEGHPAIRGRKATGAWQDVSQRRNPTTEEVLDRTYLYMQAAEALTGIPSWLYTGRAWLDHVRTPPRWAQDVPLWLAVGAGGRIPRPWTQCLMHQYSAKGEVAGIKGPVDLNHFHGEREDLVRWAERTSLVPAPPDVDRAAAVADLAEGAPPEERAILLRAARELGALRRCV